MPYNHSIKAASPSGTAYTGRADGLFSLNEQVRFKSSGLWATAISAPGAPIIGTATYSSGQATVAFTAPSSLNGSTITGYTVTSSGGQTASGASSPIILTGLSTGSSYTFTAVANSNCGNSAASVQSNTVTTPLQVGQAYGGGFYAGQISTTANGVATHYLIVAPKASGESPNREWGQSDVTTGITSVINGPTNSASLAALGAAYQAAVFCKNLTIGGYSDWYLPAKNELEVLYYFLKPADFSNYTSIGSNANAVSPEPISTNYTSGSPAKTSAVGFGWYETNAFGVNNYWSSTETDAATAWNIDFGTGEPYIYGYKYRQMISTRAVRRVAV